MRPFLFVLTFLIFTQNFFLSGQSNSILPMKYKFKVFPQIVIKNSDWQISKINQTFNVSTLSKTLFLANIGTFVYYKNILIIPSLSLGVETSRKITTFQANITTGYHLLSLTETNQIFLNLKYKYATFQYILDYLNNQTSITLNTTNFNGGTLRLFNVTSLLGVSLLSTHFNDRRSFYNNIEIAYLMGIGPNYWYSNRYNLNTSFSLSEHFSFLEILVSF